MIGKQETIGSKKKSHTDQRYRLVLGTAQLGMPYGIANKTGQPDIKTAEKIVAAALDNGICEFDTAQAYGTSEAVLGKALKKLGVSEKVNVITKLHPDLCFTNLAELQQSLEQSLVRLGITRLKGLMLHREDLLDFWHMGLGEMLNRLIQQGFIGHLGVSVYSPEGAHQALRMDDIDMIQVPSNILDRRFENVGIFDTAKHKQKEIYVRSVFLQGLLLKELDRLNHSMSFFIPVFKKFASMADEWGMSCHELSIGYVKHAYPEARILFGVETPEQVRMNVSAWNNALAKEQLMQIRNTFDNVSENILNPALWP